MGVIYTIGFTRKSARDFFDLLRKEKIDLVADVRLNNTGQLAGFTKKKDLEYFLSLVEIKYEHWTNFAPTKDMRNKYHATWNWKDYECSYQSLLKSRNALEQINKSLLHNTSRVSASQMLLTSGFRGIMMLEETSSKNSKHIIIIHCGSIRFLAITAFQRLFSIQTIKSNASQ